jgi:hypothetical protein
MSSSGRPASGCNTLGSCERIRVPLPAARIITVVDIITSNGLSQKIKINVKQSAAQRPAMMSSSIIPKPPVLFGQ